LGAEQHDQPAGREGAAHAGHHQPPDHAAGDERTLGGYIIAFMAGNIVKESLGG